MLQNIYTTRLQWSFSKKYTECPMENVWEFSSEFWIISNCPSFLFDNQLAGSTTTATYHAIHVKMRKTNLISINSLFSVATCIEKYILH